MNQLLLYNAQHSVNMQHDSSGSRKALSSNPPPPQLPICGLLYPVVTHPPDDCLAYCSDGLLVAVSGVCVGSLPLGDLPAVETGKICISSTESFSAELAHTVNHA